MEQVAAVHCCGSVRTTLFLTPEVWDEVCLAHSCVAACSRGAKDAGGGYRRSTGKKNGMCQSLIRALKKKQDGR